MVVKMKNQKEVILRFFPATLREPWENSNLQWDNMEEIRIRVNQPIRVKCRNQEELVTEKDNITSVIYHEKEMEELIRHLCRDSVYAYEEERRQGFLTLSGGHRIGITGELTRTDNGSYIAKYIRYMNIRIAHEIKGIADDIMNWLTDGMHVWNTLIVSAPGMGKTTLLRDIVRNLSNGGREYSGGSVGVIDERGEIAGAYRGIASLDCGMRTDIITGGNKTQGVRILIRTFAPKVIAMDEIGTSKDAEAILYAGVSGCSVIATVHGSCWSDLDKKEEISSLIKNRVFQRILFLHMEKDGARQIEVWDEEGKCLCGERLSQECLS